MSSIRLQSTGTSKSRANRVHFAILERSIWQANSIGTSFYKGEICLKIGYVRVSTEEQNTARQEALMESLDVDELFIDKMSGKNRERPELQRMLSFVRKGDVVIVESISRFARNTKDLLELIEFLSAQEVTFVSQKESIDTRTPTGKFMLTIFGAVAELEREYILQRQREGIEIAKAQGKYTGRKPIEHPEFSKIVKQWQDGDLTAVAARKKLGMTKTTFYRKAKQATEINTPKYSRLKNSPEYSRGDP